MMRVSISWNQSRALSQRLPRVSKTEGSPVQVLASRRCPRGFTDLRPGLTSHRRRHPRSESTTYRLPKLPANLRQGAEMQHPYVFKEPFNESQFLLRKDPLPKTALRVTLTSNSNEAERTRRDVRQTPLSFVPRSVLSRSGPRARRLHPAWRDIATSEGAFPMSEMDRVKAKLPRTPPQSAVDSNTVQSIQVRVKTPAQPMLSAMENTRTKFPAVFLHNKEGERRLTWQLSPYDNKSFDKQGLGPNQGPFSREMPKKCMPPANWLRMKLRHRIHMRKAERENNQSLAMA